jgi:dihydrofolate reductase
MAKVIANMSMSLDGYVADENDGIDEVFEWLMAGPETVETEMDGLEMQMTEKNAEAFKEGTAGVGAVMTGRRTSDLAGAWGGQHPVGVPTWVVSHRQPPDNLPESSTVHFVDDIEEAVRQAKEAAGDGWIGVAGGDIVRQLLDLGLVDEIRVDLVPVVLGKGVPFFGEIANAPIALDDPEVTEGDRVTHLHYKVRR